jgi:dTDP-4-amino-4,6-dideoxygalactose transaminase
MGSKVAIPFLDLQAAYTELSTEIKTAIHRVINSGCYISGKEVENFENLFAEFCNANYCVGVGNGTDALTLALRAFDIGPGDEVIVPSNTYIATWLAISAVGATPVPVEPLVGSYNIDSKSIEKHINPRTKIILPVHLYGIPADMDSICQLANKYKLIVIEDAAQAHGSRIRSKCIGGHGDVVAWSFYPSKNLGALGDGGAITTNNVTISNRIRKLANYGSSTKNYNDEYGINSRLDPIQAAVLTVKLRHLNSWNKRRQAIAQIYSQELSNTIIKTPKVPEWAESVWHLYVVATPQRKFLQTNLNAAGIQTMVHYPIPPHLQIAYHNLNIRKGSLPISERYADEVLSLPIGPHLAIENVEKVIECIKRAN